jgi:hypothetical protein
MKGITMLKTYPNEPVTSVRTGDVVRDKGYNRTFIAESDPIWDEYNENYVILAATRWLNVSDYVDIQCEEIDEDMYV